MPLEHGFLREIYCATVCPGISRLLLVQMEATGQLTDQIRLGMLTWWHQIRCSYDSTHSAITGRCGSSRREASDGLANPFPDTVSAPYTLEALE